MGGLGIILGAFRSGLGGGGLFITHSFCFVFVGGLIRGYWVCRVCPRQQVANMYAINNNKTLYPIIPSHLPGLYSSTLPCIYGHSRSRRSPLQPLMCSRSQIPWTPTSCPSGWDSSLGCGKMSLWVFWWSGMNVAQGGKAVVSQYSFIPNSLFTQIILINAPLL